MSAAARGLQSLQDERRRRLEGWWKLQHYAPRTEAARQDVRTGGKRADQSRGGATPAGALQLPDGDSEEPSCTRVPPREVHRQLSQLMLHHPTAVTLALARANGRRTGRSGGPPCFRRLPWERGPRDPPAPAADSTEEDFSAWHPKAWEPSARGGEGTSCSPLNTPWATACGVADSGVATGAPAPQPPELRVLLASGMASDLQQVFSKLHYSLYDARLDLQSRIESREAHVDAVYKGLAENPKSVSSQPVHARFGDELPRLRQMWRQQSAAAFQRMDEYFGHRARLGQVLCGLSGVPTDALRAILGEARPGLLEARAWASLLGLALLERFAPETEQGGPNSRVLAAAVRGALLLSPFEEELPDAELEPVFCAAVAWLWEVLAVGWGPTPWKGPNPAPSPAFLYFLLISGTVVPGPPPTRRALPVAPDGWTPAAIITWSLSLEQLLWLETCCRELPLHLLAWAVLASTDRRDVPKVSSIPQWKSWLLGPGCDGVETDKEQAGTAALKKVLAVVPPAGSTEEAQVSTLLQRCCAEAQRARRVQEAMRSTAARSAAHAPPPPPPDDALPWLHSQAPVPATAGAQSYSQGVHVTHPHVDEELTRRLSQLAPVERPPESPQRSQPQSPRGQQRSPNKAAWHHVPTLPERAQGSPQFAALHGPALPQLPELHPAELCAPEPASHSPRPSEPQQQEPSELHPPSRAPPCAPSHPVPGETALELPPASVDEPREQTREAAGGAAAGGVPGRPPGHPLLHEQQQPAPYQRTSDEQAPLLPQQQGQPQQELGTAGASLHPGGLWQERLWGCVPRGPGAHVRALVRRLEWALEQLEDGELLDVAWEEGEVEALQRQLAAVRAKAAGMEARSSGYRREHAATARARAWEWPTSAWEARRSELKRRQRGLRAWVERVQGALLPGVGRSGAAGMLLPVSEYSEAAEALRPGLLDAHAGTWRLLLEMAQEDGAGEGQGGADADSSNGDEEDEPGGVKVYSDAEKACKVARYGLLGLSVLAGLPLPWRRLKLACCVAAGVQLEVSVQHPQPPRDPAPGWSAQQAAEQRALALFRVLAHLPSLLLLPRNGTESARLDPGTHSLVRQHRMYKQLLHNAERFACDYTSDLVCALAAAVEAAVGGAGGGTERFRGSRLADAVVVLAAELGSRPLAELRGTEQAGECGGERGEASSGGPGHTEVDAVGEVHMEAQAMGAAQEREKEPLKAMERATVQSGENATVQTWSRGNNWEELE